MQGLRLLIMRTTTISVLGILVEMLQYRTESTALPSKSDPVFEPIKKTVLYIRKHYAEKLTLDLLSKIALIDKYRLLLYGANGHAICQSISL